MGQVVGEALLLFSEADADHHFAHAVLFDFLVKEGVAADARFMVDELDHRIQGIEERAQEGIVGFGLQNRVILGGTDEDGGLEIAFEDHQELFESFGFEGRLFDHLSFGAHVGPIQADEIEGDAEAFVNLIREIFPATGVEDDRVPFGDPFPNESHVFLGNHAHVGFGEEKSSIEVRD